MKRIFLLSIFFVMICASVSMAASLNLRAQWIANAETDMKEYRLYRTDVGRVLVGVVPHPETLYNFSVTVPDQSKGTLTFVLTAVDTSNNQSADSLPASYTYNLDTTPPVDPKGLTVANQ